MTYADQATTIRADVAALAADADAAVSALRSQVIDLQTHAADDAATIAALETRIRELTPATPPPVVAPAGRLPYAPPLGWASYKTYLVPASGGTITIPAGTDALLLAPSVITGPLTIKGGRHRVLVGARLGGRKTQPTGSYDSTHRGIRLSDGDDAGVDHLEGIYAEAGTYLSDFVQVAIRTNMRRVVQIQNCRVDATSYGTQAGVHADILQCWGGPATLRVHGLTASRIGYQGMYLDCADGRTMPTQLDPWRFTNVNLVGLPGVRYLYANRQPAFTRATADNVWISGSPYNNADSFGNAPAGVRVGTVADFAPASLWASSYVSPGYV